VREDVGIGSVNENGAGDFARVKTVVDPDVKSRSRRTDQYVGRLNARRLEERVKIGGDGFEGARGGAWINPSIARAIIPAGAGLLCDLGLYGDPAITRVMTGTVEDDGRTTFPKTKEIEGATADVYGAADLRKAAAIAAAADLLVHDASDDKGEEQQEQIDLILLLRAVPASTGISHAG
jgi:hypothetical protein